MSTENGINFDLNFKSLKPIEVPVTIEDKNYILREASEDAAIRYKDAQLKAMRVTEGADGNKASSFEKISETESLLVSLCLFERTEKGLNAVPLQVVKSWLHRIVHPIFEVAEQISDLKTPETREQLIKDIKRLQAKLRKIDEETRKSISPIDVSLSGINEGQQEGSDPKV